MTSRGWILITLVTPGMLSEEAGVMLKSFVHSSMLSYALTPWGAKTTTKIKQISTHAFMFTHTHAHLIYPLPSKSLFIFVHASECVCVCVYMCRLTAAVCFEGHRHVLGSDGEGGTPCSNYGALIPVYLSVYEIHREQGDRTCWHMHSAYRKPVMVCRVTGRQRSYGRI